MNHVSKTLSIVCGGINYEKREDFWGCGWFG